MGKHYGRIIDLPEEDEKLLWSLVCLLIYEAIKQAKGNPHLTRDEVFSYLSRHDLRTIKDEITALIPEFSGVLQKQCKKITKTNARALLVEGLRILDAHRGTQDASVIAGTPTMFITRRIL